MKRKVGILGGTFNPIHLGHLLMAQRAYEQYKLDIVYFMPNKIPPHKDTDANFCDWPRIEMIEEAINDIPYFGVLPIEMEREGKSYTVDTLGILKERYPDDEIYFIVGGDSIFNFEKWYRPDGILKLATLIVAARDKGVYDDIDKQISYLAEKYEGAKLLKLEMPLIELSSTEIRDRAAKGQSIKYMVHDNVEKYIVENHIYR